MGSFTSRSRLQRVYRAVPDLECKGLCRSWCSGGVATTAPEREILAQRGVTLTPLAEGATDKRCPALTLVGQCSVYEDRPLICRLWGAVENMPCPHGCVPKEGRLTVEEGGQVVAQMVRVGGEAS